VVMMGSGRLRASSLRDRAGTPRPLTRGRVHNSTTIQERLQKRP